MMTPAQIAYELDYWLHTERGKNDWRQRRILDLWGFYGASRVVEIGTGPWGGCLPFLEPGLKVGIDPLYMEYERAGLLVRTPDWDPISEPIEQVALSREFDAALCMNTLDHGDSSFAALDVIARLLVPGGRMYLHVNLRTAEQLNEGHDHALTEEDLQVAVRRNRLCEIDCHVFGHDPIERSPYRTVVGVWQRA